MRHILLTIFISFGCFARAEDTCDRFSQWLSDHPAKSIESLLTNLQSSNDWSTLLQGYNFVFDSQSLQRGSLDSPRVILYSPDARVVMAFLGKPAAGSRDTVEVTCWREQKSAFEYHELAFDGKNAPQMKNPNPPLCLRCHGADPRPNWQAYNFWPGVYGAIGSAIDYRAPEYASYPEFLKGNRKQGRYTFLPPARALEGYQEIHVTNARVDKAADDMTENLSSLNEQRVGRILNTHPQFAKVQFLLRASKQKCSDIETFVPENLRSQLEDVNSITQRISGVAAAEKEDLHRRSGYPAGVDGSDFLGDGILKDEAYLIYPMSLMGLTFDQISMGFEAGTYNLTTPGKYSTEVISNFFYYAIGNKSDSCENLKAASLESLKGYQVPQHP